VERTQEILFYLGVLHHAGELDPWQVFLDSPMAIAVTRVYDRWLEFSMTMTCAPWGSRRARPWKAFCRR
jgi:Cft2 family RNA processing exonuclease